MAGRIKMKEEEVSSVASNLLNDAKTVQGVLDSLQAKYLQTLNDNWEGEAKNKFVEDFQNSTIKLLQNCVTNLNNTGNSLKQIVEMFIETDNNYSGKTDIK
ncbi:WXG100 family type VII secretion target [Clostridium felsineum]|uniref:WXG100 family type VII secretion target n=1 Tax=Clostridium felsineum TaxID=36839 RepID=UPI00098CB13F|nr:WXG100 family type VII secretion target [Clostridium felsineum]URZ02253.1 hypothetical protein CLAUR_022500 [Clostridium felsineum]